MGLLGLRSNGLFGGDDDKLFPMQDLKSSLALEQGDQIVVSGHCISMDIQIFSVKYTNPQFHHKLFLVGI